MAQWRIRVVVPDGPGAQQAVRGALALVPSARVLSGSPAASGSDSGDGPGDVVVDLADEASLGDLLRTLHEISPQIFVSRVPSSDPPGRPRMRVRKLGRVAGLAG